MPKVQKKKPVNKSKQLSKALKRISIDGKKKLLRGQTSQESEIGKRSLRLRKVDPSKEVKKVWKKKKKVQPKPAEEAKESSGEAEAKTDGDKITEDVKKMEISIQVEDVLKTKPSRRVNKDVESITKAIKNVLRKDSTENQEKKHNSTPEILKRKAKEIVSKARKAHLLAKNKSSF